MSRMGDFYIPKNKTEALNEHTTINLHCRNRKSQKHFPRSRVPFRLAARSVSADPESGKCGRGDGSRPHDSHFRHLCGESFFCRRTASGRTCATAVPASETCRIRQISVQNRGCASIGMVHLSRFAEDLIFFNTGEAGFVELSDRVTSGSSLMPQKKNPDALELIRGKCGRVQGALTGMMMTLKGLPLAYNKDMQEDKEGVFDALDTWLDCLHMAALVLDGIQVKRPRCQEAAQQGYANATELADYLVAKGVPFREAHHIVGEAVVEAIAQGKPLEDLPLADLQKFSPVIGDDVYPILSLQSCLDKRAAKGGVSPKQVAQAISDAKARLS